MSAHAVRVTVCCKSLACRPFDGPFSRGEGLVEHGIERLPHEYIKLLKTQDQAYINMKRAQDSKASSG
eukprot:3304-Eustigmatos_ZCMA.PRE.1